MAHSQVLVVDDEPDLLELAQCNLEKAGYEVSCVVSGEEALSQVRSHPPDLILLDVLLPGVDGLDVCKMLKQQPHTAMIPIIMVTACSTEADIVSGLELGADDYLAKPFSPRVLLARVKAALRRKHLLSTGELAILTHGAMVIHPGYYEVRQGDHAIRLTPTEFRILYFLAQRPGWVYTRYQIVDEVRGAEAGVTERSVDVHVAALRRKLGEYHDCIATVRGVGYRFKD